PRQAADQGLDRPSARRRPRRWRRRDRPDDGDAAGRSAGHALQHEWRTIRRRHPGRRRGSQHAPGAAVDLSDGARRCDRAALERGADRGDCGAQGVDPLQPAPFGDDHGRSRAGLFARRCADRARPGRGQGAAEDGADRLFRPEP
ncbi:hypothetical protein OY671_013017, partial [Metschnikowia pulcherrima]